MVRKKYSTTTSFDIQFPLILWINVATYIANLIAKSDEIPTRNVLHVTCMWHEIIMDLHVLLNMHVAILMYMHVSCNMHGFRTFFMHVT